LTESNLARVSGQDFDGFEQIVGNTRHHFFINRSHSEIVLNHSPLECLDLIFIAVCNKDGDAAFLGRNQKFENPSL